MEKATFVQKVVIKHPTENEKFLLLIRNMNDKSRPGDYDLPGGSVEEGELHEEALKREVNEETKLSITNIKPIVVNSRYNIEDRKYFLYIGYSAIASNTNVILNPEEHSDCIWITLDEFKSKVPDHILMKHIEASYS